MNIQRGIKQKTNGRKPSAFHIFLEVLGWLQIAASPFIIGIIFGAIIYFPAPSLVRLIIAIVVAVAGMVIGVVWATREWKRKGTTSFMSRIMATPELDKPDERDAVGNETS